MFEMYFSSSFGTYLSASFGIILVILVIAGLSYMARHRPDTLPPSADAPTPVGAFPSDDAPSPVVSAPPSPIPPRLSSAQKLRQERIASKEMGRSLRRAEAQQEKLSKNLKGEQEQSRQLRILLQEQESLVRDLRSDLRRKRALPITWTEECQMHEKCHSDIHALIRVHAKEMAEAKAKLDKKDADRTGSEAELVRQLAEAKAKFDKQLAKRDQQLAEAEAEIDRLSRENLDLAQCKADLAQCKADLTSQIDNLAATVASKTEETKLADNRTAIIARDLRIKTDQLVEAGYHITSVTDDLKQRIDDATEAAINAEELVQNLKAQVKAKDAELQNAAVQAGQVVKEMPKEMPKELQNALARIAQLEDDKAVLLMERYPQTPQPPVLYDTEMTDIPEPEDIEMGDADAVSYVEMGPTPSLSVQCHDCKAEKLRLEDQARAYREWIIQDSKADKEAYRKQVMAEYAVAKEKLREQVEDELVSEIEAQFTEQCEAWRAEINKGHADEINEANKAKAAVWRRVKGLEKQISDMEEASAVRDATLRQLQSGLQPAQGSLARPSQPPRSALRQPSQAGEQSAARPQGPGVRFDLTTNAGVRPPGTFGLGR